MAKTNSKTSSKNHNNAKPKKSNNSVASQPTVDESLKKTSQPKAIEKDEPQNNSAPSQLQDPIESTPKQSSESQSKPTHALVDLKSFNMLQQRQENVVSSFEEIAEAFKTELNLLSRVSSLEKEKQQFEKEKQQKDKDINRLGSIVQEKEATITGLQLEVKNEKKRSSGVQHDFTESLKKVKVLEDTQKFNEKKLTELENKEKQLNRENSTLRNTNTQLITNNSILSLENQKLREQVTQLENDFNKEKQYVITLLNQNTEFEKQIQQQKNDIEELNRKLKTATLVNNGTIRSSGTSALIKRIEEIRKKIVNDVYDVIEQFYEDIKDQDSFEPLILQSIFEHVGTYIGGSKPEIIEKTCTSFTRLCSTLLLTPHDFKEDKMFKELIGKALEMNDLAASSQEVALHFVRPQLNTEKPATPIEYKTKKHSKERKGKCVYECIAPGLKVGQDEAYSIPPILCEVNHL